MTEFEKMGCTYRQEGDYFLPNLKIGEQDEVLIGVWGQRHRQYLKKHHHVRYYNLLTAGALNSYLIDHIEVYETQGVGKSRTQRITIHYRFVGYIDIPAAPLTSHYISETRQGVAVEYIPA